MGPTLFIYVIKNDIILSHYTPLALYICIYIYKKAPKQLFLQVCQIFLFKMFKNLTASTHLLYHILFCLHL